VESKVSSLSFLLLRQKKRRRRRRRSKMKRSLDCNVFEKVNGLLVALCFGGCRVLGCIIVVVFMVCEYR